MKNNADNPAKVIRFPKARQQTAKSRPNHIDTAEDAIYKAEQRARRKLKREFEKTEEYLRRQRVRSYMSPLLETARDGIALTDLVQEILGFAIGAMTGWTFRVPIDVDVQAPDPEDRSSNRRLFIGLSGEIRD